MDQPLHSKVKFNIDFTLLRIYVQERAPEGPRHNVTRYRRRDLRADILGDRLDKPSPPPPKYRIRVMHIPLDVSDYTLDDLIKEFGRSPVYSKVFDTKEDRTFLIEFESLDIMNEFVTKYNNYEIADGFKVTVELFEQKPRKQKRNNTSGRRVGYGSHYQKHEQPQEKPKGGRARKERLHKPTLEELDAQLAAYMNSDSKEASESSQEPK